MRSAFHHPTLVPNGFCIFMTAYLQNDVGSPSLILRHTASCALVPSLGAGARTQVIHQTGSKGCFCLMSIC